MLRGFQIPHQYNLLLLTELLLEDHLVRVLVFQLQQQLHLVPWLNSMRSHNLSMLDECSAFHGVLLQQVLEDPTKCFFILQVKVGQGFGNILELHGVLDSSDY